MDDMAHEPQHVKDRSAAWRERTVVGLVLLIAAILLTYSGGASYWSLRGLAVAHGVPLPQLFPIGLDGGLAGAIILDIGLTWLGMPIGWLRQVARLFALGTVAANATAGWPDVVGSCLRVAAPVLIVVIAEAVRTTLLRRARGGTRDPVPGSRWVLAFPSTFRLWRRMKLWQITSYSAAIDMEMSRLQAMQRLADRFGEGWRGKVPGTLTWMLGSGVRMDDALALVAELTAPPKPALVAAGASGKRLPASSGRKRPASKRPARDDIDTHAEALRILDAEPEISGSELGRRLGKDPSYGRALKAKLTRAAPGTGPLPQVVED